MAGTIFKMGDSLSFPTAYGFESSVFIEDGHIGSESIWGRAKTTRGETVFVKKFNNPTSLCEWQVDFCFYLREVHNRLQKLNHRNIN